MNNIQKRSSFQQTEKKLKNLISKLEDRLRKTDLATEEAKKIRAEIEKLKKEG